MNAQELKYFEELKKEVTAAFQKSHPNCNSRISDWKGQDITDFQEDLINKVHGRISEKWFYTHIKSPAIKLPRIDMLNMLSEYAGYKNWNDFLGANNFTLNNDTPSSVLIQKEDIQEVANEKSTKKPKTGTKWGKLILLLSVIFILSLIISKTLSSDSHSYTCCFVDIDGHTPIKNKIRVTLLMEGESSVYAETNANGCLELQEQKDKIKFVINTPYFHPDTFARILNKEVMEEKIQLKTDDYAIMIHYFSKSNIKDWAKRRLQLNDMIADNAKIFQVYSSNDGMELFNKNEFIDKLTMPLKSLRNVEILDVKYSGIRISELRFTQTAAK
ncbi:MAG: hypothetical protein V4608_02895 [Bacteroidota bacterium]